MFERWLPNFQHAVRKHGWLLIFGFVAGAMGGNGLISHHNAWKTHLTLERVSGNLISAKCWQTTVGRQSTKRWWPEVEFKYQYQGREFTGTRAMRSPQSIQALFSTPESCNEFVQQISSSTSLDVWVAQTLPSFAALDPTVPAPLFEYVFCLVALFFIALGVILIARESRKQ